MGSMRTQKYRSLYKWNMQLCNGPDCDEGREWPVLYPQDERPEALGQFVTGRGGREGVYTRFVGEKALERLWDRPERYDAAATAQFGLVAPLYPISDRMPLPMVMWNTYRGRAIAYHWQAINVMVMPSADWLGEDTYDLTLSGLPRGGTFYVSTAGKSAGSFEAGLRELVSRAEPELVMVGGPRLSVGDVGCELWWEHGAEVTSMTDAEVSRMFGIDYRSA